MTETLSDLITAHVNERGKTLQELATSLGVHPTSLRTWMAREKYPDHFVAKLAPKLGTTSEKLREQFPNSRARLRRTTVSQDFSGDTPATDWAGAPNLKAALEHMEKKVARYGDQFEPEVEMLFGNMDRGDIFIYHSAFELPFESTATGGEQLWRIMKEAVKRGAYFIYLIPTPRLLNQMEKWKLDVKRHSSFKTATETIRSGILALDPTVNAKKHVLTFEFDELLFSAPDHKFVLFKPAPPTSGLPTPPRLLALYPVGTRDNSKFLHLPLGRDVTNDFIIFLRNLGTATKSNGRLLDLLSISHA